jgi:DNA-binding MarR family transcriptional regulator
VRTDRRLQGPLFDSPTFVLMQAGRLAMEAAARTLEPFGLTVVEYATLLLVRSSGGISQGVLGARLDLSKASICRVVTRLERRRLVERRQHMLNPARRALFSTGAGLELLFEAATSFAVVDARYRKCLGDEAAQALAELPPRELSVVELALRAAGWG